MKIRIVIDQEIFKDKEGKNMTRFFWHAYEVGLFKKKIVNFGISEFNTFLNSVNNALNPQKTLKKEVPNGEGKQASSK